MILLKLFLLFCGFGLLCLNGGGSLLQFYIDELVTARQWLTLEELGNFMAVSQITPGPIGVNLATFLGFRQAGWAGGLAATLSHSEITGWTIVGCMNMAELLKSSKEANDIYMLTAIVLVLIAMLLSIFISKSITHPIQKLRDSMKRVQEGDFTAADLPVPYENEIGSLTQSFNVMTHKIEDLME